MQLLLTAVFLPVDRSSLTITSMYTIWISNPDPSLVLQPYIFIYSCKKVPSGHAALGHFKVVRPKIIPLPPHPPSLLPNTFKSFLTEPLKSLDSIQYLNHEIRTSKSLVLAFKTHYDLISTYFSRHVYLLLQATERIRTLQSNGASCYFLNIFSTLPTCSYKNNPQHPRTASKAPRWHQPSQVYHTQLEVLYHFLVLNSDSNLYGSYFRPSFIVPTYVCKCLIIDRDNIQICVYKINTRTTIYMYVCILHGKLFMGREHPL